jgi:hypothetical protein
MEEQEPRSQEQKGSSEAGSESPSSIGIDAKRNQDHDAYAASDNAYYRDAQMDRFTDELFKWIISKKTRPHEWIVAFSSIAMLIVVGWQAYSSPTSGQTQQLIHQATIQAEAAEKFRIAAEGINAGVGGAVGQLGLQVGKLDTQAGATKSIAIEALAQATTAREAFEAQSRPYVSVGGVFVTWNTNKTAMTYRAELKNNGRIPATAVHFDWQGFYDGIKLPKTDDMPLATITLDPGRTVSRYGDMRGPLIPPLRNGISKFVIFITYSYQWRKRTETACWKEQYDPYMQDFSERGFECAPK